MLSYLFYPNYNCHLNKGIQLASHILPFSISLLLFVLRYIYLCYFEMEKKIKIKIKRIWFALYTLFSCKYNCALILPPFTVVCLFCFFVVVFFNAVCLKTYYWNRKRVQKLICTKTDMTAWCVTIKSGSMDKDVSHNHRHEIVPAIRLKQALKKRSSAKLIWKYLYLFLCLRKN